MKIIANLMSSLAYQSAEIGALSILYAAVSDDAKNGGYYGLEKDQKGYPMETTPADSALSEADAKRLRERSEELTGVRFTALDS